jgi:hypothetical protein
MTLKEKIKIVEAENAALKAELRLCLDKIMNRSTLTVKEAAELRRNYRIAVEALRFYANEDNWESQELIKDPDWIARKALKQIGEIE